MIQIKAISIIIDAIFYFTPYQIQKGQLISPIILLWLGLFLNFHDRLFGFEWLRLLYFFS